MTLKSIQGHEIFKKLYLINGACYDQSLYETHIEIINGHSIYLLTFELGKH
jgi:hypothetical protein